MSRRVRTIGIVLETRDDALRLARPLEQIYHWREPEEISAVKGAIENLGFEVRLLGTPTDVAQRAASLAAEVDFVFNISVGFTTRFRMALAPALYELCGVPYSGADPYGKMVSQNKQLTCSFLTSLGIPVAPWRYCDDITELSRLAGVSFPVIVKPAWEGASVGIDATSVVTDVAAMRAKAGHLMERLGIPVIVQHFVKGRELKVGIVGGRTLEFEGIIEDVHGEGEPLGERFLFFEAKKAGGFDKRRVDTSEPWVQSLLADCRRLYRTFYPLDYATFDLRVDDAGHHYFLEFNADATLHPRRTLAECCRMNEFSYEALIAAILRAAFARQDLTRG